MNGLRLKKDTHCIMQCTWLTMGHISCTVNVDIFALYIFSRYSRLLNVHENIYIVKKTFIMLHRGNNIKNAKINPHKIANFRKCVKMYTSENISLYYNCRFLCFALPIKPNASEMYK